MENNTSSVFKRLFSSAISSTCYHRMVIDLNFFDEECSSLLASKVVGYFLVVFTSIFVKFPQLLKIWRAKSGSGVSVLSQGLTMFSSCSTLTYSIARGHPISVWGEIVALNAQNLTILLLLFAYSKPQARWGWVTFSLVLYVLFMGSMLSPFVPLSVHQAFQACSLPITASSKIIQIVTNYRNGSTGQLSALSIFSMNGRSFGRVFTHIIESGDMFRIMYYGMTGVLNSLLTAQVVFYTYVRQSEVKSKGTDSKKKLK